MQNNQDIAKEILYIISSNKCEELTDLLNDWTKGLFVILRVIEVSEKEVTAGDIASALKVSTARVAVALNTLEAKKWIKKHKSYLDARKTIVELTDLGKEVLETKKLKVVNMVSNFLDKLTIEETNQLLHIIKKTMEEQQC